MLTEMPTPSIADALPKKAKAKPVAPGYSFEPPAPSGTVSAHFTRSHDGKSWAETLRGCAMEVERRAAVGLHGGAKLAGKNLALSQDAMRLAVSPRYAFGGVAGAASDEQAAVIVACQVDAEDRAYALVAVRSEKNKAGRPVHVRISMPDTVELLRYTRWAALVMAHLLLVSPRSVDRLAIIGQLNAIIAASEKELLEARIKAVTKQVSPTA